MTCPVCGAWSPCDRETGYDADEICPSCSAKGFVEALIHGERQIINEHDEDLDDPRRI